MKIGDYEIKPGDHWISVYEPIVGWKYIEYWLNPEMGGFVEPWQTSPMVFEFEEEAIEAGITVAELEGLPFIYP